MREADKPHMAEQSEQQTSSPTEERHPRVSLQDICLKYGEKVILDGISLEVCPGEIVAVLGPSGSGKSTLIKIVAGLLVPDSGQVTLSSNKIGMAFQYGALFSSMSIAENLSLVLERTTHLAAEEIENRIRKYLTMVGLEEVMDKLPNALSGGMQKRVGIARALAIQPDIMLLDEPSAGLDPILASRLEKDFSRINEELQLATILVTHEMPTIENLADRVVLLYKGKFVYQGTIEDFLRTDEPHAYQFRTRNEAGPIEV
jgi:phospholipid/cholesterol/gamma-HCH transport system ATP-binding protein